MSLITSSFSFTVLFTLWADNFIILVHCVVHFVVVGGGVVRTCHVFGVSQVPNIEGDICCSCCTGIGTSYWETLIFAVFLSSLPKLVQGRMDGWPSRNTDHVQKNWEQPMKCNEKEWCYQPVRKEAWIQRGIFQNTF